MLIYELLLTDFVNLSLHQSLGFLFLPSQEIYLAVRIHCNCVKELQMKTEILGTSCCTRSTKAAPKLALF